MRSLINIGKIVLIAMGIWGCANQSMDTPEAIQSRLVQLREQREKLESEIQELEAKLAKLDTTLQERRRLVDVIRLNTTPFAHYLSLHGEVTSDKNVSISSEIGGQIVAVYVKEGQWVKKGTPLVKIDDQVIRHNIEELEIQLNLAKEIFEKQARLWKDSIGSEVQYLQAKTQKEALEKRLASLRSQLAKTEVRAPFSGRVDRVFAKVGQIAAPGLPLLQLIGKGDMKIKLKVPESYIQFISPGQKVKFYVPDLKTEGEGIVFSVGEGIDPVSRSFMVEITPRREMNLKPHMAVEAYLQDYKNPEAIVVPSDVISKDEEGKYYVYIVEKEGKNWIAKKQYVQIGYWQDNRVEIREGLKKGDLVVFTGHKLLVPNQYVTIVKTYETGKNEKEIFLK